MTVPMQAQFLLGLQSILLGASLGLFYDILRAFRVYFSAGRLATALYDLVFWLVLLAAFFEFSLVFAMGQSRWYVLAGACVGAGIYFFLLSGLVQGALRLVLDLAARLCGLFVTAGEKARGLAGKAGLPEKIRSFTKKFANPSSIFRRKGIK